MNKSLVYLTGFMGSGKSTIGSALAQTLNFEFLDLDTEIETVTGMSIPEIFRSRGENGFREIERHALDSTTVLSKTVVALGGGAATSEQALGLILAHGFVVYLQLGPDSLLERLSLASNRPLIAGRSDLPGYISEKLAQRQEYYRAAHLTVDCSDKSVDEIVSEIAVALPS